MTGQPMQQPMRSLAQQQMRPAGRLGISLVELLVTLAIISMLIALLMPAISNAREAARNAQCKSQLHQQSMALAGYRMDNKRMFPMLYTPITDTRGTYTRPFSYMLSDYLGTHEINDGGYKTSHFDTGRDGRHVFYCPSAKLYTRADYLVPLRDEAWLNGPSHDYNIGTYSMLSGLGYGVAQNDPTNGAYPWMRTKRRLTSPNKTLIFIDGRREVRIDHSFRFYALRHNKTGNWLRGDYSVTSSNEEQITQLFTQRVFHLYDPNKWRYAK